MVAELDELQPPGFSYSAMKLEDGLTFIHVISKDNKAEPLPGKQLDALREFHSGLRERCEVAPTRTMLSLIGAYNGADQ